MKFESGACGPTRLRHAGGMTRTTVTLLAISLLLAPSCKKDGGATDSGGATAETSEEAESLDPKWPTITLDGELMSVRWSDGDSFKFKSGPHEGKGVRLMGYNTLESYGPVHRWGDWTAAELYAIAKSSWKLGASQSWSCTTAGEADHYGRLLVDCPDAAEYIISEGHGHIFALEADAPDALVKAQRMAQKRRVGMWEKGVPDEIITSLHSADEGEEKAKTYNRVVDTKTGKSREASHKAIYEVCEEVCLGGDSGSCMTYVPFSNRYKNKPPCLEVKEKGRGRR